jgi:hypothetical protein
MEEKKFVAIRMIVLKPGEDPAAFRDWMTKTNGLLDTMGGIFSKDGGALERITFLQGNKEGLTTPPYPRQSDDPAEKRKESSTAGANADFAWITYWTSKQANQKAWQTADRPDDWDKLWKEFLRKCHPRGEFTPSRPGHGPPYDYLGGVAQEGKDTVVHHGRGAGCLVEGFEVIYDKCDWS